MKAWGNPPPLSLPVGWWESTTAQGRARSAAFAVRCAEWVNLVAKVYNSRGIALRRTHFLVKGGPQLKRPMYCFSEEIRGSKDLSRYNSLPQSCALRGFS